jgi:hypothetical protein
MRQRTGVGIATFTASIALLAGCGQPTAETSEKKDSAPTATGSTGSVAGCPEEPADPFPHEYDEALHDELIAMLERDQSGRSGGEDDEGDVTRSERLRQILAEHGWPGFDLVGEDGEDAAWAIAQHADLDPDLQRCALEHLRAAVDQGQGSPGNLAYLSDRIAVSAGEPQRYGTQVACGRRGRAPKPQTPLAEPDRIEQLRKEADLEPWADYLAQMEELCGGGSPSN